MKISILVLKFLFVGALFIITNHNLHLINPVERQIFYEGYYSWLGTLFDQISDVTGYVVSSKWLPGNISNVIKP